MGDIVLGVPTGSLARASQQARWLPHDMSASLPTSRDGLWLDAARAVAQQHIPHPHACDDVLLPLAVPRRLRRQPTIGCRQPHTTTDDIL